MLVAEEICKYVQETKIFGVITLPLELNIYEHNSQSVNVKVFLPAL